MNRNKLRKLTPDEYYQNYYSAILAKRSINFMEKIVHKTIERKIPNLNENCEIFEIGAGNGEHLAFVKHKYGKYYETDIRIDQLINSTKHRIKTNKIVQKKFNANDLASLESDTIDRFILTCVLMHLDNVKTVLTELRRVGKNNSVISIYVPCEPGLLLRLARYFTTAKNAKKIGIDHLNFHYQEHRYHILHISEVIKNVFADDKITRTRFPINYFSWNFNLWEVYQISLSKNGSNVLSS